MSVLPPGGDPPAGEQPAIRPVSRPATVSRASSTQPRPRSGPSGAGATATTSTVNSTGMPGVARGAGTRGERVADHQADGGRSGDRRGTRRRARRRPVVGVRPTSAARRRARRSARCRRRRRGPVPGRRRRWPAAVPRSPGSPPGPARCSPRRAAPARGDRHPVPAVLGERLPVGVDAGGEQRRRGARGRAADHRRWPRCVVSPARSTSCLIRSVSSSALCAAV